jgi:Xaa-Pro aminopeptidase
MSELFTTQFFSDNRRSLSATIDKNIPIVITANGLLQKSADATFPFRQDGNFWYLTGINLPDILIIIDGQKEYLIIPTLTTAKEHFDGHIDTEKLKMVSGITTVLDIRDGWELIKKLVLKYSKIATLLPPPKYSDTFGFYTNPARQDLCSKIHDIKSVVELVDIRKSMSQLRMVKQEPEIRAIKQAITVTIDAINDIKKNIESYKYEYEIEAELTRCFRKNGGEGHAFDPIIASGSNACTIHYMENNSVISRDNLILFDIGAQNSSYAADISRTIAINNPSNRQLAVHKAVCEVQDYAFSIIKPGLLMRELELKVEEKMGQKLIELGLIKEASHESIRKYYPHAVSHFLGYDVHDAGDYETPLQSGCVITIEPGIYIPEEGIGIRIEDDVLVTDEGISILSEKLSRDLS